MGLQAVEVFFVIQLAREGRLDFFCITDSNTYLCAKDLNMTIKGLLAEIKADLHKYDDSGAIDTSSVYRWAEIALKRFGGVIAVMSEAVVKTSNKQAVLPSDFFDMLDAYRCEPLVCEIPGGDKAKADLQHEIGWVERTAVSVGTPAPSAVRRSLRRRSRRGYISGLTRFDFITIIP